jgi:hypothetical protein
MISYSSNDVLASRENDPKKPNVLSDRDLSYYDLLIFLGLAHN